MPKHVKNILTREHYLSPFDLLLAFSLVVGSWLFFRSPIPAGVILLLVCIPGLMVIPVVWALSRYRWSHLHFPVQKHVRWSFWFGTVLLVVLIPTYTYYTVGPHIDRSLTRIGIQARLLEREIHLLDDIGDIGDVRRVIATYEIQESLEEATEKLRTVTVHNPSWKVWHLGGERHDGTKEVVEIYCEPSHSIGLYEDGILIVIYRFSSSNWTGCFLP